MAWSSSQPVLVQPMFLNENFPTSKRIGSILVKDGRPQKGFKIKLPLFFSEVIQLHRLNPVNGSPIRCNHHQRCMFDIIFIYKKQEWDQLAARYLGLINCRSAPWLVLSKGRFMYVIQNIQFISLMQGKRKHYVQQFHGHQGMYECHPCHTNVCKCPKKTTKPQTIQPPGVLLFRMLKLEGCWDAGYCSSKEPEHNKSWAKQFHQSLMFAGVVKSELHFGMLTWKCDLHDLAEKNTQEIDD